jgi:hypothetical protein
MDIRTVSDADKLAYINRIKEFFAEIRDTLNKLEKDIENKNLSLLITRNEKKMNKK